jgi:hypothetical protein
VLSPGGRPEVPCARCDRREAGLPWGEICTECRRELSRRASRIANRISLAATALMGAYVAFQMPPAPMARLYGAIAVVATYIIVRRLSSRVAMEMLK